MMTEQEYYDQLNEDNSEIARRFLKGIGFSLENKHTAPTAFQLAVDESTSITAEQFKLLKSSSKKLCQWIKTDNGENMMKIYAFNEDIRMIQDYTNKLEDINLAFQRFTQKKGNTNAMKAFDTMREGLYPRINHQVLIMLTDGDFKLDPQKMLSLMSFTTKVFIIFIGDNTPRDPETWCSHNGLPISAALKISSYERLDDLMNTLQYSGSLKAKAYVTKIGCEFITLKFPQDEPENKDAVEYHIEYLKKGSGEASKSISTGWSDAKIPNLEPDTEYSFRYRIRYKLGNFSAWSSEEIKKTMRRDRLVDKLQDPNNYQKYVDDLLNQLRNFEPTQKMKLLGAKKINILLAGRIGAGKSNFISTIKSIFRGRFDDSQTPSGNSATSFTPHLRKIPLTKVIDIWDIFGINQHQHDPNKTNYDDILDFLLKGQLKEGIQEYQTPTERHLMPESLERSVHVALFVVECSTIKEKEDVEMIKNIISKIRNEYHIPTLMVLTKVDKLIPPYESQLKAEELFSHPEVMPVKAEAAQSFDNIVTEAKVYPFMNYLGPYTQDLPRELVGLTIMERSVEEAVDHIENLKGFVELRSSKNAWSQLIPLKSHEICLDEVRQTIYKQVGNINFLFEGIPFDRDKEFNTPLSDIFHRDADIPYIILDPNDSFKGTTNILSSPLGSSIIPQPKSSLHPKLDKCPGSTQQTPPNPNLIESLLIYQDTPDKLIGMLENKVHDDNTMLQVENILKSNYPDLPTSFKFLDNENKIVHNNQKQLLKNCYSVLDDSLCIFISTQNLSTLKDTSEQSVSLSIKGNNNDPITTLTINPKCTLSDLRKRLAEKGLDIKKNLFMRPFKKMLVPSAITDDPIIQVHQVMSKNDSGFEIVVKMN